LLICGDSFSADWTTKYPGAGWPNLLALDYTVTNLSQAGCSEYKIYQQLKSVDLSLFDHILVAHTSPYRIYVTEHPVHAKDTLHCNSDLIYSDLIAHVGSHPKIQPAIDFFEQYFNIEHAEFIHELICQQIEQLLSGLSVTHIINFEKQYNFSNSVDFTGLFRTNRGLMNHYDETANTIIYNKLKFLLQNA
jgi:Icc-related predicted phosphoesterase